MNDPPRFECLERASSNYSRVDCFDTCFMEAAQNACQCVIVTNMKKNSLPACTTYQYYFCIYFKLKEQFSKEKDTEGYFYRCRQRCTPRCTYHQYTSFISYSKFPSDDAKRFTVSEAEWTRMKNTIIIDIYYEKLEYTLIKHYRAMTIHVSSCCLDRIYPVSACLAFQGFIANLGGQYSLWLGGSILTLVQLLVFLVNYLFWTCCNGKIKKKLPNQGTGVTIDLAKPQPDRRRSSCENGHYRNIHDHDYRSTHGRRSISPSEQRRHADNARYFMPELFHSSPCAKTKATSSTSNGGMYICGEAIMDLSKGDSRRALFKRSIPNPAAVQCDHFADRYACRQESAF